MDKKILFGRSIKDLLISVGPSLILFIVAAVVLHRYLDPAPPNHFTIATGDNEGDYQTYAKDYVEILKRDGVTLNIRASKGPIENLKMLEDDSAGVDAAFVHDGLGSPQEQPDVVSLGSLYYEPLWIFYRGKKEYTRLSQLQGLRIAVGHEGQGTRAIAIKLLKQGGITDQTAQLLPIGSAEAVDALKSGSADVAFFLLTPEDPLVRDLSRNKELKIMSLDQAEAISRRNPYLHHLTLPHGVLALKLGIPDRDVDMVAPTATLLVRDDLHPALVYLLLKAAAEVHSQPGMLEHRGEFPTNKDDEFPLSEDAQQFYKSGGPFWQRYLPFWLAAWLDRFILVVIPLMALVIPLVRLIPRIYAWRIRSRIYKSYGELKFIETQSREKVSPEERRHILHQLDSVEDRVDRMKLPLEYTEHIYSLRGHIHFVRERLTAEK